MSHNNSTIAGSSINGTNQEEEGEWSDRPFLGFILDTLILCLCGVAFILVLIAVTYYISRLTNYCRRRFGSEEENRGAETYRGRAEDDDLLDHGIASRKARLFGLQLAERKLLLDKILESTTFLYSDEKESDVTERTEESSFTIKDENEEGDIEMGIPDASSLENDESKEDNMDDDEVMEEEEEVDVDQNSLTDSTFDDTDKMCSICLASYEPREKVMMGVNCRHMFHAECAREWLLKNDCCPYCRSEMMSARQLRQTAEEVLGKQRVQELTDLHRAVETADARAVLQTSNGGTGETTHQSHTTITTDGAERATGLG